ncbi:MAG: hypothetical protein ACK5M0_04810 [Bacteroidales bacterium]
MKKILIILFLFSINYVFSQGKLTCDGKYFSSINQQLTNIVKSSINEEKIVSLIKIEADRKKPSLFITINQDSTGLIKKVELKEASNNKFFTKRELRKIKRQIKKMKGLDIYVDPYVLHYLQTKEKYFSMTKYNDVTYVIRLSSVSD